jgi:MoaA/NifB/PqqE/SkfB family radical SAM enzyme
MVQKIGTVWSASVQKRTINQRLANVPVLSLMPHSRCNCRCVMCDIWRANRSGSSIDRKTLERMMPDMRALGVRWVLLSGGEALMHPNLWALCALLKELGVRITLLSTGLLLVRHADAIAQWCDEVIVSLDGPPAVHDAIRRVPGAFERLREGGAAIRAARSTFPLSARSVVQKRNFREIGETVDAAHALGLDRISFLAADVSSTAFNRPGGWSGERTSDVALDGGETTEFCALVERMIVAYAADFASGFIAETPEKLRRLGRYYSALNGNGTFAENRCNAPWVSAVVEADGTVRPCFFHDPVGNITTASLREAVNSEAALAFRQALDVRTNPVCRRCVCTFNL